MYYLKPHWRQQNNAEHAECELEEEDEASHQSKAPERLVLRSPDTRQKPRDQHGCYQRCSGMQDTQSQKVMAFGREILRERGTERCSRKQRVSQSSQVPVAPASNIVNAKAGISALPVAGQ